MSSGWLIALSIAGGIVALMLVLALALWWMLRRTDPERAALAKRIGALSLRNKVRLAVALMRDRRVPLALRAVPAFLALYLAMPVDLIPDFIPVLGQLDDVLVLGLGVALMLRLVPRETLEEHIERLERGPVAPRT